MKCNTDYFGLSPSKFNAQIFCGLIQRSFGKTITVPATQLIVFDQMKLGKIDDENLQTTSKPEIDDTLAVTLTKIPVCFLSV